MSMEMKKSNMRMWGYLPSASLQRAPLLRPTCTPPCGQEEKWRTVCGGGCGFALAISESGKISMWGSTKDLGQCDMREGKLQDLAEPYSLNVDETFVAASGGCAHSVAITETGHVYTWGWSNSAPSASFIAGEEKVPPAASGYLHLDNGGPAIYPSIVNESRSRHASLGTSWEATRSGITTNAGYFKRTQQIEKSCINGVDDGPRKRVVVGADDLTLNGTSMTDENLIASPSLVFLALQEIIISVAAGGRHTLALSDAGKVWGWGYGGEGQLGLGSRMGMMSRPQLIPSIDATQRTSYGVCNQNPSGVTDVTNLRPEVFGTCVTRLACGGRHSAVLTDGGAVLTFGWGLYGQCGQGSTEDQLYPVYVSALGGIKVTGVAAGLWHTAFISEAGDVYASGGNQFGQLGTGGDQAEMVPTLIDAPALENDTVTSVSCGARHTAVLTETGRIFCWGWNKYGQLGVGDTENRDTPVEVQLENAVAKSVACGWWHTLVLVGDDSS